MIKRSLLVVITVIITWSCADTGSSKNGARENGFPFTWNNANVYFLLTDRFNNADPGNDLNFGRTGSTAVNRGFQGGDLRGITEKIREGYFTDLGITAIWMTPFFEQIHGMVDEGTGATYGYHGYWTRDWTALDPNFGTEADLEELVSTAHAHGIRIVMDIIINHTGPVTEQDPVWPEAWVRTSPRCTYEGYESTIECTLVDNLPDIRTETEADVPLPPHLLEKWESEGRLEKELAELDVFFATTGYPRAPKYYIIKWLTDYIRKYGINAYRIDTAKHTEEGVWSDLRKEADRAYSKWLAAHPELFPENDAFYMVGEVYNYVISGGPMFDYGDTLVDFFAEGIDHLINFEFKYDARNHYETIFAKYASILHDELEGKGVMNYISSHDDGDPLDKMRENPFEAATKLLLCPGASQVYYGDESSRLLFAPGANGDANLRSFMNWDQISENAEMNGYQVQEVLAHYGKLGRFRREHPAVGAGTHEMISMDPYIFVRTYNAGELADVVVIGLDLAAGTKKINVEGVFPDGTRLTDGYSGEQTTVRNGFATIHSDAPIVLLGRS
jgi:alpha-amylase